jgi:hypothetical protein
MGFDTSTLRWLVTNRTRHIDKSVLRARCGVVGVIHATGRVVGLTEARESKRPEGSMRSWFPVLGAGSAQAGWRAQGLLQRLSHDEASLYLIIPLDFVSQGLGQAMPVSSLVTATKGLPAGARGRAAGS